MRKIAEWTVRRRLWVLLALLAATLFFGRAALRIEMYTAFSDLLPKDHPFIRVHNRFAKVFGGANLILLSVEVRDGDIFNPQTLKKIKHLTEVMELTPGVNNYQIFSIARQKVKDVRASSWGIEVQPVMWPEVPRTPEEIGRLRDAVFANPTISGRLVSRDGKAALITAAFHEERLDYARLFARVQAAIRSVEDANTKVYAAGEPILYGWIYHHLRDIGRIIAVTCLAILGLLTFYYRNLNGVLIPLLSALVTFIWGMGFNALLGFNFEPLVLVVPFLIAARTISHSIQFRERFFEELERWHDKEKAAAECAAALMMPGSVSILTDAIGLTVLLLAPMPILTKLAIGGSFWVLSNLFTVVVLDPVLCCYFPVPRRLPKGGEGHWLDAPLRAAARACTAPAGQLIVIAIFAAVALWSAYWYRHLTVGDSRPGSPLLWPDSPYNVSVARINEKFEGTDHLYVIVEGKQERAAKLPEVLRAMEAFQRTMERSPHVGGTDSLVGLTRQINTVLHNNDPRWGLLPRTEEEVGGILMIAEHGSEPGDFDRWVNYNFQHANITLFLRDHKGDTIRDTIERARDFIARHPVAGAEFRLAGGLVGVLAAANEVIARSDKWTLGLMLAAQLVFCAAGFRSLVAALLFVGVVLLSNTFGMALMAYWGLGLNVNTLPVVTLGIGFGEDYGIYVVSRVLEEYRRQGSRDLRAAVVEATATAGKAVLYTAVLISAGIAFWAFSPLRFQAEMGYQLLIILTMNMLGGLLLLPALIGLLRPRFVTGEPS
ncbi:MAG TPA: MMPL family transporter [candidate division Zixibacteria bacterium]|nr:MMPL family transporter [candidate division Zixibacteria bacterium]